MASTPKREIHITESRFGRARVSGGRCLSKRHSEAVIQAEVRRLARALRPYGVLHRNALERAAGADRWREGSFDGALSRAVGSGAIERLPAGFLRSPRSDERGLTGPAANL